MKVFSYPVEVVGTPSVLVRRVSFTVKAVNRINAVRMAVAHPMGAGYSFSVPAGIRTLQDLDRSGILKIGRGKFSRIA